MLHRQVHVLLTTWQAILQLTAVAVAWLCSSLWQHVGLILQLQALQSTLEQKVLWQTGLGLLLEPYKALI